MSLSCNYGRNMKGFKKKCHRCGKFTSTLEMVRGFGMDKCKRCASIRKINQNAVVNLPKFVLQKINVIVGEEVKFTITKKGILMTKQHGK